MRAALITASDTPADHGSRVAGHMEDRLVQQLVVQAAVERFADAVLDRPARRNEMPGDRGDLRPGGMLSKVNCVP